MSLSRVAQGSGGVALGTGLTLADAKAHLDVYHSTDDTLITAYCSVARSHLEGHDGCGGRLGRAITPHVLDWKLPAFPAVRWLDLPRPPVTGITSITYRDLDDVTQTLASSSYHLDADDVRPRVVLAADADWPDTIARPDAVTVRFSCGPDAVPADLLHALKLHVGHLYLNRETTSEKSMVVVPHGYDALIALHKTHGWI